LLCSFLRKWPTSILCPAWQDFATVAPKVHYFHYACLNRILIFDKFDYINLKIHFTLITFHMICSNCIKFCNVLHFFRNNWNCMSSPFWYSLLMPISWSLQRFSLWTGIRLKLQQRFLSVLLSYEPHLDNIFL